MNRTVGWRAMVPLLAVLAGLGGGRQTVHADVWVYPDPTAQPGDFNTDGQVEQTDLTLLLQGWGSDEVPAAWTAGFDGLMDQNELNDLLSNWGAGVEGGGGSLEPAAVPEPVTVGWLALAATGWLVRRERPAGRWGRVNRSGRQALQVRGG